MHIEKADAISNSFFIYLNGKPKLKYNRSPSDLEEAITLSSAPWFVAHEPLN